MGENGGRELDDASGSKPACFDVKTRLGLARWRRSVVTRAISGKFADGLDEVQRPRISPLQWTPEKCPRRTYPV